MGELHLGGMLNPRLALVGDVFAAVRYWDDAVAGRTSAYSSIWTIALQYWVTNIVWLKGGLGWANLQINDENTPGVSYNFSDESGPGHHGRGGRRGRAVLQLRARSPAACGPPVSRRRRPQPGGFLVGINWY